MEGKLFLGPYLIWVILLWGQLHGCKSCIEKEREALLDLKNYMISRSVESIIDSVLPTWNTDINSDCCRWEGIECNRTSGRVIGLSLGYTYFRESSLLNLSWLHPFEDVQYLNLSSGIFDGFVDDVEGYRSLRRLRHLEILDLSSNRFNNSIFPFLNAATSLRTLLLGKNSMNGPFPFKELKDLTNLELLDLSGSGFNGFMPGELTHMKKMKSLDISSNLFSTSSIELQALTDLANLEVLNLSRNRLNGSMQAFTHLKRLRSLDLSSNRFSSLTELQELKDLTNLEFLDLSENRLKGSMLAVCEMKSLRELDLRGNDVVGKLPLCLGSLKMLRVLDLSSNQLSGNLPYTFNSLESLEYLSLLDNNFTCLFSLNPLTNLTKLKVFKLSSIPDMVQVETESTWQPKFQLSVVVLRFCSLEKIPFFLGYQNNLRLVDLSSNRLSGDIPTWLLMNNPELEVLQLQNNSFTIFQMPTIVHNLLVLDFSANNIGKFPDNIGHGLPNLVHMNGSNNGFQGKFPSSMGDMKNISFLDLSYNNFSGKLPRNFFKCCLSLRYLKLSHNKFSGRVLPRGTRFTSMRVLSVDNNLFSGKIAVGLLSSTTLLTLDMSNNCLKGPIPSWLCKLSYLDLLLISNNFLEGTIPPCLLGMSFLSFLDLSGNLLSGVLPSHVHRISPINLFLHDNNFTGPIPDTLLKSFEILDLRNNKLSGSIPQFVNTQDTSILLLRGNNLTGSIPKQLCELRNMRLLDLSYNKLHGVIPSCLNNLSFGPGGEKGMHVDIYSPEAFSLNGLQVEFYKSTFVVEKLEEYYYIFHEIEIKFALKRRYDSYSGTSEFSQGILGYMSGMDLSSNELSGVIPAELGDLSIQALNLSHNFLSSSIPSSFSNLKDIESLDLSHNMLQGSIPQQLTGLNFLAVFDVSYNNLSGIIPQGRHFDTFDENSYLGNPLLCGPPTKRSCEAKKSIDEASNGGKEGGDEAAIDMVAFYISTASTYVTALIGIVVLMCFDCPWRRAWLRIVEGFIASAKSMFP